MDKYLLGGKIVIGNLTTEDNGKTWFVPVAYTMVEKEIETEKVINYPVDVNQPLSEKGCLQMPKRVFEKIIIDEKIDTTAGIK